MVIGNKSSLWAPYGLVQTQRRPMVAWDGEAWISQELGLKD